MHKSPPILVTGSHRSGSTWAGRMLAAAPHVGYIHEPFNPGIKISVNPKPFKHWFTCISQENAENYRSVLEEIFNYKYPLLRNLSKIGSLADAIDVIRDQSLSLLHGLKDDRPLVKDPFAVFSVEWLCSTFNTKVLIMVRHPAAFCSSLKIKDWDFGFDQFLAQPLLMGKFLDKYAREMRQQVSTGKDIIDQAILLWNCIHHVIAIYRERHPEWLFVRHEDLSQEPVAQFRSIYQSFDLEFTDSAERKILASSGGDNPAEQQAGKEFMRDSRKNIKNWKNRLSGEEIERIRRKTAALSSLFYPEDEW
jgi:hypothetical protein